MTLEPFPHQLIDNFISADTVRQINAEWPEEWFKESTKNTTKWSTSVLPPAARRVVDSIDPKSISELTGIEKLKTDPGLFGAGLHCIPRGGFLNMHVDFNRHPLGWHRRVNLLIYLNRKWKEEWAGHLQLGIGDSGIKIAPIGGRCVIFETNDKSWHGHPEPLECPANVQRRSLALYFYTRKPPEADPHTTIYVRHK